MTLITPEELADLEAKARAAEDYPINLEKLLRLHAAAERSAPGCAHDEDFQDAAFVAVPRLIATIRALTARAEAAEKRKTLDNATVTELQAALHVKVTMDVLGPPWQSVTMETYGEIGDPRAALHR